MTSLHFKRIPALLCLAWAMALGPAHAESLASSASVSASGSSGSVSDSIEGSSKSSKGGKKVAEGEYRIIDVTLDTHPLRGDIARIRLQGEHGEFVLRMPRETAERSRLTAGNRVMVTERSWGYRFSLTGQPAPFYLALNDVWQGAFTNRRVDL